MHLSLPLWVVCGVIGTAARTVHHIPLRHRHRTRAAAPPDETADDGAGRLRRDARRMAAAAPTEGGGGRRWRGALASTNGDFSVPMLVEDRHGALTELDVIVDTGSSNLAVAVASCDGCGEGATSLELQLEHACVTSHSSLSPSIGRVSARALSALSLPPLSFGRADATRTIRFRPTTRILFVVMTPAPLLSSYQIRADYGTFGSNTWWSGVGATARVGFSRTSAAVADDDDDDDSVGGDDDAAAAAARRRSTSLNVTMRFGAITAASTPADSGGAFFEGRRNVRVVCLIASAVIVVGLEL